MTRPIHLKKILWAAPVAGVAAAIANALIYFIAHAMGAIPDEGVIPTADQPITVVPVLIASFFPAIIAGALLAILALVTEKAIKVFIFISTLLLVLSFYMPFTIPEAFGSMILVLNLMHVVAAVVIVGLLIKLTRK